MSVERSEPTADREVVIERVFEAPARLLFLAYTRPEYIKQWFGPKGWPVTLAEIDFRVGGTFRFAMTGPSGEQNTPFGGTYLDIVPNRKIAYDNGFEMEGAERMVVTITFDPIPPDGDAGKTKLTIHTLFGSVAMRNEHVGGGYVEGTGSGLDQLEELAARLLGEEAAKPTRTADREITLRRTFDAPRALVYRAFTRPEHVDHWFGPRGFQTTTAAMDVRPGGQWTFQMAHPQYGSFPNRVRYIEVVEGERLVYDHDAGVDGDPEAFLVTVTFEERDGKTELTMCSRFQSVEACEGKKKFGVVEMGHQTLEKLAEYLSAAAVR